MLKERYFTCKRCIYLTLVHMKIIIKYNFLISVDDKLLCLSLYLLSSDGEIMLIHRGY